MGKAAELIFAKHTRMKSRSTYGCQGFIYHWNSPLRETLTPLFDGYVAGLEIGDTESSAQCLGFHVAHTFYAGLPLDLHRGFAWFLECLLISSPLTYKPL